MQEKVSSFDRDDMSLKARRARDAVETTRAPRARRSAAAAKRATGRRVNEGDPTPERLAKGDLAPPPTRGSFHRAVPPVERLRDQNKLDHHAHINQGMFEAAERLKRHFIGCGVGVKAQDLTRVRAASGGGDLEGEEGWVHHRDHFRRACTLMGWSDANPHRGAGRLVVAVVCEELTVTEAALIHIGSGRAEAVKAAGMDRLREGLFALAVFWRLC